MAAHGRFDLISEGETVPTTPGAGRTSRRGRMRPFTWWLETRWTMAGDADERHGQVRASD